MTSPSNTPVLLDNEVHLVFCPTPENLRTEQLNSYRAILNHEENSKVQRYRFEKDQLQSLLSRALLRTLCTYYLGSSPPEDWNFKTGEKGKPSLTNNPSPLHFNVSHTQGMIAIAMSKQFDIGVDVEHTPRNSDTENIAERYFSELEVIDLHALPKHSQSNHFFDYWTLKESYIKACGLGLAIPLDSFSFHINRDQTDTINSDIQLQFHKGRQDSNEHWQSFLFDVSPIHRGALSVHTKSHLDNKIAIQTFSGTPLTTPQAIKLPFSFKLK